MLGHVEVKDSFWNDGDGTFTNGTIAAQLGTDENGMGSTLGDFDLDGDFAGVRNGRWGWGTAFFDYGNDGDLGTSTHFLGQSESTAHFGLGSGAATGARALRHPDCGGAARGSAQVAHRAAQTPGDARFGRCRSPRPGTRASLDTRQLRDGARAFLVPPDQSARPASRYFENVRSVMSPTRSS